MNVVSLGVASVCVMTALAGCAHGPGLFSRGLNLDNELTGDQLVVHSDFDNAEQRRLFDQLAALRPEILAALALPASSDPVHVYLFTDESRYLKYTQAKYPEMPERRAFFVSDEEGLKVFAYWGDYVVEDLRHEVTHGYLHSIAPRIPLWLDEGLAEYFETPDHRNAPHIEQLTSRLMQGGWRPNLARLESLTAVGDMEQIDYAESWAWIHFLLNTTEPRAHTLQAHLRAIRADGSDRPLAEQLKQLGPRPEEELMAYLMAMAPRT
jgi:hypothetical protein